MACITRVEVNECDSEVRDECVCVNDLSVYLLVIVLHFLCTQSKIHKTCVLNALMARM